MAILSRRISPSWYATERLKRLLFVLRSARIQDGWRIVRVKGSSYVLQGSDGHYIYTHPLNTGIVNAFKDINQAWWFSRATLNKVMAEHPDLLWVSSYDPATGVPLELRSPKA